VGVQWRVSRRPQSPLNGPTDICLDHRGGAGRSLRTEILEMQKTHLPLVYVLLALMAFLASIPDRAADSAVSVPTPPPVEFRQETLDNGLRVIYAPLHQA